MWGIQGSQEALKLGLFKHKVPPVEKNVDGFSSRGFDHEFRPTLSENACGIIDHLPRRPVYPETHARLRCSFF